ncbi:hypothetical protein SAMN06265379_106190 [Saccharicrinis carchari]|uniref:Uncharacterized protein n=1 Tax=Saccharicrinis carchari TaxID=1168039 RepID=A0A521DUH2_SACCC|nr:hypothetical protein SAMN06265379_106190 [Saccharicrinis carchari]
MKKNEVASWFVKKKLILLAFNPLIIIFVSTHSLGLGLVKD